MKNTRSFGALAALLIVLGLLPGVALAEGGNVTVCKYTGGPDGEPSHLIEVAWSEAASGDFPDAHASVILGHSDERDWTLEDCPPAPGDDDDGTGDDGTGGGGGETGDDSDGGGETGDDSGTGGGGTAGGGDDTEVADRILERIFGETRIQTAVEVANESHPDGAEAVVLARSDLYPDALTGGPLARALGAPVLLTPSGALHDDTAAEIERLGAPTVYLLGQRAALSATVADAVDALAGVTSVERIGGPDRFATAGEIAAELDAATSEDVDSVYLTEGVNTDPARGWPDAVAVSGLASHQARPILLSAADDVSAHTLDAFDALEVDEATLIGGEAALSAAVLTTVEGTGAAAERVGGQTRYETSAMIARRSVDAGLGRSPVWLATGLDWPDALVAGPAVAAEGGVLVLVHGQDAARSPTTSAWLDANEDLAADGGVDQLILRFVGGPAAIADAVLDQLR